MNYRLTLIVPAYLLAYTLCYFFAFLLRFEFAIPETHRSIFWHTLPYLLGVKVLMCVARREWQRTYRYVTFRDVLSIGSGATMAAAVLYAMNFLAFRDGNIPRSVIVIDWAMCILAEGLLRGSSRISDEIIKSARFLRSPQEPTIIYRADWSAIGILRAIEMADTNYSVVGFVDDDTGQFRGLLAGRPVISSSSRWAVKARKLKARHVLIPSTVPGRKLRSLLEQAAAAGLKAHVIPSVDEIVDGAYKLQIRDVTISDLLRREPNQLDMNKIRDYVGNRRVLITGAAGSIGSELCRQVAALDPSEVILVDQSELGIFTMQQELGTQLGDSTTFKYVICDVTDRASFARVMTAHQPRVVFHAAAYKHVPLMEDNPQEAIRNNVLGTRNVVDLVDEFGVEAFVLISTDKAVRPSSVMGATKFMAEKYVQAVAAESRTRMVTVRFGNVLDSAGSVVPTFRRQIHAGGPVTVTHPEMTRYFMTIPEAVQLVLQAGAIGSSGDVLILEMGIPVRIVDLARDLITLSGLKYPDDIDIVFTGIRPGEKLTEELFYETERGYRKVHDKIFRGSRSSQVALPDIRWDISRLETIVAKSAKEAGQLLHEIAAAHADADGDAASKTAA